MRILVFILLIVSCVVAFVGGYYYFLVTEEPKIIEVEKEKEEEEKEEEEEKKVFDEDFIKNEILDIYCPLDIQEGEVFVEDLSSACNDDDLPQKAFSASIHDFFFLDEKSAVLLIESKVEDFDERFDLIAIDEEGRRFARHTLQKEAHTLQKEDSFVKVEDKRFRLIVDRFEEVAEKNIRYASPGLGFSVEIPENWQIEKKEDGFLFYHPESLHTHPVKLTATKDSEDYDLYTPEKTPYEDVYKHIKDSLTVNEIDTLPDYNFLAEDLEEFLKINTETRIIEYHKEGEVKEEFEVLNMVDREHWGGVPVGLYEVLSKEGVRFSSTTEVYMPFSVRFYGKYLIHGEPYYPSGAPYISQVSGGCIRVKNEKMEKLYDLLERGTPILVVPRENGEFHLQEKRAPAFPEVSAESFLVADADSGKVFAERDFREERSIASITKMMTAIVAIEQFATTQRITVRDYMLTGQGETEGIYPGRVFRIIDLLRPLLVESSNNAAMILSHLPGKEESIKRMNEKAEMIGMRNTEFVDPSGIEEGNISTAEDVYYLAYYILNSRVPFLNISSGTWTTNVNYQLFPNLVNKNIFYDDPAFVGGKSGFTNASKHTGFYIFNLEIGGEEREVIFVLLGSRTEKEIKDEIKGMIDWLQEAYN